MSSEILVIIPVCVICYYWIHQIIITRNSTKQAPFKWLQEHELIACKEVKIYHKIPISMKNRLINKVECFLNDVEIRPGGDLQEISERTRIMIAVQACLLLCGKKERFRHLRVIVVFSGEEYIPNVAGMAFGSGSIALALKSVRIGAKHAHDGYNIVMHELAHHLDFENPLFAGIPFSFNLLEWFKWAKCLRNEEQKLKKGHNSRLLNDLKNHPNSKDRHELFAYAVEHFFEKPNSLFKEHQELYLLLKKYFQLDPRKFSGGH
jgi:MtfA peptidase